MADQENPDDQPYNWLYGGRRPQPPAPPDPEATQPVRRQPPGRAADRDDAVPTTAVPKETDQTRVLGVRPPAAQRPADPVDPSPGQQSFGGTYPAPGRDAPRFAEPSRPQPVQQTGFDPPRPPSRPVGTGSAPPPRWKRRTWWVRGIVLLFVGWLIFLVAVPIWTWKSVAKVDAEPSGGRPADTAGTTYLLVGSDSRTNDPTGQRTDTIILLHVPSGDGPTLVLSVPRDSFVDIPGHGMNKINAAFAFGGPDLLVRTLEQATNVRVDDYIEVGFSGFVDIVDAVGGIQVCPEVSINDPKAGNLRMTKGCQDVDGRTALGYARSRAFHLGDITRAKHQREVIAAVGRKAASWQTIVLPWRYLKVNRAAADTLTVGANVGPVDLARFAWAMAHSGGTNAKRCVVPYSDLGASTSAGTAVLWDRVRAEAVFRAIRNDDTAAARCASQ